MKKWIQLLFVLSIAMIYCVAITPLNNASSSSVQHAPVGDQVSSGSSVDNPFHLQQSEGSTSIVTQYSPAKSNVTFLTSSAVSVITEQLYLGKYCQYERIAQNLLVKYRKTDIFFPFHYFW